MKTRSPSRDHLGLTLVELLVAVAVVAVVLLLAAPSFRDLIDMRRLRGTAEQLHTDLQFARSEAASRQELIGFAFNRSAAAGGMSCYIIYTTAVEKGGFPPSCDCTKAAGARCSASQREIRTVQLDADDRVRLMPTMEDGDTEVSAAHLGFDPTTGNMNNYSTSGPSNGEVWIRTGITASGNVRTIRTVVNATGRPRTCRPADSVTPGIAAC